MGLMQGYATARKGTPCFLPWWQCLHKIIGD